MSVEPKSTTANPKSRLRPPTQRDLDIYQRVRLSRHQQRQVAAEYGVDSSRICQIVRRVERWLAAGGSPSDPNFRNALAQRRLARSQQKLRLQRAVELAAAALETAPQPATKTRRRIVAGEEVWREESQAAAQPINLYALQNYVAAVKALDTFENRQQETEPNEPIVPPNTVSDLVNLLCRFRVEAEATGQVNPSRDIYGLVITTLKFHLGENVAHHSTADSEARAQFALKLSAIEDDSEDATPCEPETSVVQLT